MALDPAVGARALTKRFGQVVALDGVDLAVQAGEIRGLLGRNGAGKTTLLRILLGLARPDRGSVSLLGRPAQDGVAELEGLAGVVEEPRFYPYLSGRENLELLARLDAGAARSRVEESLALVDLTAQAGAKVGGYSSGMCQRLGLAASLVRAPRLLLLDEPTSSLDAEGAQRVRVLLRRLADDGVTIVLSSHDMHEVDQMCESVTVLHSGRVVWDGTLTRLRSESQAPAFRLVTSDDERALALAGATRGLEMGRAADGVLTVSAPTDVLDAFVLALGGDGIAVRRLELATGSVESMFIALTGPEDGPARDSE